MVRLAAVVVATFAVCWLPYMSSWQATMEVLERLTPVKRGLFEDYVANFWCVTSLAIKWRRLFSQQVDFSFKRALQSFWHRLAIKLHKVVH